jgi:hypothetical protein
MVFVVCNLFMGCQKIKINFAGGCPAASYFLLLRQNKVAKEKATPVCRPLRGFPALLDWPGFLINSHDPLRVHVLKHIRQNSLTSLRYSAAHRGKKSEIRNLKSQGGHKIVPTLPN